MSVHQLAGTHSRGTYDAVVIGGGLVGASIAYGLRKGGARVAVLDEGDVAYRASRGNAGLVWLQGKGLGLGPYANWTRLSTQLWPSLAALLQEDTGVDVHLEQPGGLHPTFSDEEFDARQDDMRRLMQQAEVVPYEWKMLDRKEVEDLVPGIGPELRGASWTPFDGTANPLKLLRAYHLFFEKGGVDYLPEHAAQSIRRGGEGYDIATSQGVIHGMRVVLAAGLGNRALAAQVGLEVPVRPQRGQVIVLEKTRRILPMPFTTLRQMDEGSWIIGDAHQEMGYADALTETAVLATLADRAVKLLPALAGVRAVRSWAALRVMSQDGFPIYEQSQRCPGVYVATCHSGVTLAAVHALRFAKMVMAGELPQDMLPFSTRRFDVQETA